MNSVIEHELIELPTEEPKPQPANNMLQVIERAAMSKDVDVDKMRALLDMKKEFDAIEAKKAYIRAMSAFKADKPEVFKTKKVSYKNRTGDLTQYNHAKLDQACEVIGAALSKHGLTHHWETEMLDGGIIRVSCVITHELGHSERVPLQSGADQSGGKNNIQALGSTVTYLQRYTLLSAVGIAAKGIDDDGRGSEPVQVITKQQAADLKSLAEEVNADIPRFLKYLSTQCKKQIEKIEDIPSTAYKLAIDGLEAKRKQA